MRDIRFVLITGLSGAGKTHALACFEDMGFFCVDNLPPPFIVKFAEICSQSEGRIDKVALVCDVRGGTFFDELFDSLAELEKSGFHYEILFLEASKEVLVRRYKETRRRHPVNGKTINESIEKETEILDEIRGKSSKIIDTSYLSPSDFKEQITSLYFTEEREKKLQVTILSFGYKHSVPTDADLIFDVRFLPNPHYVEYLKALTGNDSDVREYVWKWPVTQRFFQLLEEMLTFLLPYYVSEGKSHLIIGIGCTGGKHRSVAIGNEIFRSLQKEGYNMSIEHRDIKKN